MSARRHARLPFLLALLIGRLVQGGGQPLYVLPDLGLVVAFTAGRYNATDQATWATNVLNGLVLAHLRR